MSAPGFFIETYGCQMNVADSELIAGVLRREGYVAAASPREADVIVVNTCAVRDHAEQRVFGRVGALKRDKRPGAVLGVVGCMAQRLGERLLRRSPHVDFVAGPDGYRQLPALIRRSREGDRAAATRFVSDEHYEDIVPVRSGAASAWITVQRGCDYRCTFCIVPYTRGPERSRRLADVVREAQGLVERGVSEVTLLGQTVNSYHDGERDFADLLRAVGAVDGIRRLRFTSPHPNDFSDRVIAAMAETAAVCEHVHLPAQSGSSAVLKRMLRRYSREQYLECVERLRAAIPDIALSTDLIVGFPGESEADFEQTLTLVREVGYDSAFTFRFSPREGTPATRLPDAVPDEVAARRLERLIEVVREVARGRNAAVVGSVFEVLVEEPAARGNLLQARTRHNRVAVLEGPPSWIGSYRMVRLTGTTGATFTAAPVSRELAVVAGGAA
ncbi:MAG TPA: tRNA (N6-isopentenyl adenosine(37)-C2)-methylthiotransferase MiaB [Gemmatimonadales bacterium]|nr:tRNA (N6-isopentenyl adenosine(37)-C2)-methylthiotransferase MiaB [Gemmatimonadales bacterium]